MAGSDHERIECPSCGKRYQWKSQLAGKRVRCKCGGVIEVPAPQASEATSDDLELGSGASVGAIDVDSAKSAANVEPQAATAKAQAAAGDRSCPSCGAAVSSAAVICVQCGVNLKSGAQVDTIVGQAVKTGGGRHRSHTGTIDGFFGKLSRSWEFAKISYGILWDFKQLIVFPIFSGVAALLVLASFILPLWGMGTLDQFKAFLDREQDVAADPLTLALVFAFYFANFFVIVFFNTALSACAMKVCAGEAPTVGYGLSIAVKRLPQIISWTLVSATVGLILKVIENNEKVGRIIAAIIGTAWTVLTYFVVPVLAAEGVGPVAAVKKSVGTLKKTWGEAVLGNFSMGFLAFLCTLPVWLLLFAGGYVALAVLNSAVLFGAVIVVAMLLAILVAATTSAADIVFRALLYNYATGRTIPQDVDETMFSAAFAGKA